MEIIGAATFWGAPAARASAEAARCISGIDALFARAFP
jgi:hypothetical protein